MLPAVYEKVKAELKDTVRSQVKSLCITIDIWTSLANDSMLAVTGHYIEEEEFAIKSLLLDCVPLDDAHTAKNLADTIKSICQEWNVSDKILLAVSDNGANIKSAIERELAWKHFPCYTHTLNLAVSDVLKSPEIAEILNKMKGIVRHFKKSNLAWEKLKRYQEQAGTTAKRLLQEVPTRWNSTYYMLQRCVEIREPLNSAMVNLGMSPVTSYEWELCQELCQILHPCEEVTRELSGQKYITGSLVIPITVGLIKALEQLGEQNVLMSDIDKIRQDLIGNIKRRFYNLNNSKTFGNCMFLDPRFKFYFDDPHVADETKRRMVSLVAAQHSRDAVTTNNITINIEEVEPTSCPRPIKSIWQDFERRMQGIQPEGTAQSRAIVEVQRYYDDKIINRNECPLKWWREHKSGYPTLYKIAATKLNAMASSVPCERVFSAAGNILNERWTRLGKNRARASARRDQYREDGFLIKKEEERFEDKINKTLFFGFDDASEARTTGKQ
ncbi:zinc finger BED domain-containing protein 4 [Spodoptera frugiperda]|uniref:Zinc finger BED domain-containing protein 4 n=1 Tax=Spodoptera frugiperda TaxID=7108 RepID=A0A9R0E8R5_SPOFR|nr:zinc finger BED domain-containing protein 4 [Spodoptera frugiperda]